MSKIQYKIMGQSKKMENISHFPQKKTIPMELASHDFKAAIMTVLTDRKGRILLVNES